MVALFWVIFVYMLEVDFQPVVLWALAVGAVALQLYGYLDYHTKQIRLLQFLAAHSLKYTGYLDQVNDDELHRRFVGQPVKARANGEMSKGEFSTLASLAISEAGVLVVTSDRAFLLGWQAIERVKVGATCAVLVFAMPTGATQGLYVPWNQEMSDALPSRQGLALSKRAHGA